MCPRPVTLQQGHVRHWDQQLSYEETVTVELVFAVHKQDHNMMTL